MKNYNSNYGLPQNVALVGASETMSTVDLRDMINSARKDFGEPPVENSHFIKRVEDELYGELGDSKIFRHPQSGAAMRFYDLTIEQCTLVGMRESKSVRRMVLSKIKELEAKQAPVLPQTFAEALRVAADLAEQNEKQSLMLEQQKPAVEFVENYATADTGSRGFRQVAKVLKANEKEFRAFLSDSKIMYRLGGEWAPYSNHIDAGRFEVKTGVTGEHAYSQAKFTPKGMIWIAGLWGQYQASKMDVISE